VAKIKKEALIQNRPEELPLLSVCISRTSHQYFGASTSLSSRNIGKDSKYDNDET
jgi:hypothetical protein